MATDFTEALPIGNGSFGAMVYGAFPTEQFQLNSDALWSGYPQCKKNKKQIRDGIWEKIKSLILSEQYYEAEQLMTEHVLGDFTESYVSMGTMKIRYMLSEDEKVQQYDRDLNLETAVASSDVRYKNSRITCKSFISLKDHGMFIKICSKGAPISIHILFASQLSHTCKVEEEALFLQGMAPTHVIPNYVIHPNPIQYEETQPGIFFCTGAFVHQTDGKIKTFTDSDHLQILEIEDMSESVLFVCTANGYRGYQNSLELSKEVIQTQCMELKNAVINCSYEEIYQNHLQLYGEKFHRVRFSLGPNDGFQNMPIDEQLSRAKKGQDSKALYEILLHYGRYLLLCSSDFENPWSQPANLQGIWCEDVRSVWSSNWTTNINLEMNYWLAGAGNLAECNEVLIQLVRDLSEAGKETADFLGNCQGFCVNHNVDLWRHTSPVNGNVKYAFWPMAGLWLCSHLYEHFLFTGNEEYLRETALPVIRQAVLFCIDWLQQGHDGLLHALPSTSPENTFYDEKRRICSVSYSSTIDITLIREVFSNYLEACNILECKDPLMKQVNISIKRLPPFKINRDGGLNEWINDFDEYDRGHRHFAHLVGLHPFSQINKKDTPEVMEATRKSIRSRVRNHTMPIGWNTAWLVNFYARLEEGEKAKLYVDQLLHHCVYNNLFSLHPPLQEGPGERRIFQIDGNLGVAAGIIEMLIQSHLRRISILPALPVDWKEGFLYGIKTRGAQMVSIKWESGFLHTLEVNCGTTSEVVLEYDFRLIMIEASENEKKIEIGTASCSYEMEGKKWLTKIQCQKGVTYMFKIT